MLDGSGAGSLTRDVGHDLRTCMRFRAGLMRPELDRQSWSPVRYGIIIGASACLLLSGLLVVLPFLLIPVGGGNGSLMLWVIAVFPLDCIHWLMGQELGHPGGGHITMGVLLNASVPNSTLGAILGAILGCLVGLLKRPKKPYGN
jgi:hypothetical protein